MGAALTCEGRGDGAPSGVAKVGEDALLERGVEPWRIGQRARADELDDEPAVLCSVMRVVQRKGARTLSLTMKTDALRARLDAALAVRDTRDTRRSLPTPPTPAADFTSNDYLSLAASQHLRKHLLARLDAAPHILGSGGSRLLVNGLAHTQLEDRLRRFFRAQAALLFNSGFDANVAFFSCIPQHGDAILYDEHIHASVHDGMRASRVDPQCLVPFAHNSVDALCRALDTATSRVGEGHSVFVAVESLYSMDGTFAPLVEMAGAIGNAHLVVDEAHATGIYGPGGRGRVAMLGLEDRVFARLHTFGKALAASGAVLVADTVVKDYLLNYARPLIYTTSPTYAAIIAADASFDMLEDGTASCVCRSPSLARLSHLSSFQNAFSSSLPTLSSPSHLLSSTPTSHLPWCRPLHPKTTLHPSSPSSRHTPALYQPTSSPAA